MKSITRMALLSAKQWVKLVRTDNIGRTREHIGESYRIERYGTYRVFRETRGHDEGCEPSCVLVVGFQLRIIGANPLMHWLFQRVCLLTTPFWSGFLGFRIKLWMVDPVTKNYLGIYEWAGAANARNYADVLARVLRRVSTKDSVWFEISEKQEFLSFLNDHRV
jgi:hypothetical protein